MLRTFLFAVGLMGATTTLAFAQSTAPVAKKPTSTATTKPTSAPADPSTPKGALKALTEALDVGDREKILSLLRADSDGEKKVAAAWATLAEAAATLRRAAVKAYGVEPSRPLSVDPGGAAEAMARIDLATVALDGDKATLTTPDAEGPPLVVVKHDSKWRVPVAELSKEVEPAALEQNLKDVAEQARLMKELAGEVAAGKYANALDARRMLDQRILHLAMPQLEPTTSTAPSPNP